MQCHIRIKINRIKYLFFVNIFEKVNKNNFFFLATVKNDLSEFLRNNMR